MLDSYPETGRTLVDRFHSLYSFILKLKELIRSTHVIHSENPVCVDNSYTAKSWIFNTDAKAT